MIKLSDTSKLHCKAFGLPSVKTCPKRGQVCQVCYAHYGMGHMAHVSDVLHHNLALINSQTVETSAKQITGQITGKYFRWFWSGDCFSKKMRDVVLRVAEMTPDVSHWITTRTDYNFNAPNIVVRYSTAKMNCNPKRMKKGQSTTFSPLHVCPDEIWECPGDCKDCRVCWDFPLVKVAYRFHGSGSARAIYKKLQRENKLPA